MLPWLVPWGGRTKLLLPFDLGEFVYRRPEYGSEQDVSLELPWKCNKLGRLPQDGGQGLE